MRVTGMASGMDIEQMVYDLMEAERQPLQKIEQDREWVTLQKEAYRDMNLELASFQNTVSDFQDPEIFDAYTASSSNSSVATAEATGDAMLGSYELEVNQLAEEARLNSGATITQEGEAVSSSTRIGEEGSFQIAVPPHVDSDQEWVTIEVNENDTYRDVAEKISTATDDEGNSLGLRASFDDTTSRFFMSSRETGEDQLIQIREDGDSNFVANHMMGVADNGSNYQNQGQDAVITLEGDIEVTSSSNEIDFNGMTISLHGTTDGQPINLTVESDPDEVFDAVTGFIEEYNELIAHIDEKLNESRNRDYPPLTEQQRSELDEREQELWDEQAEQGMLSRDRNLESLLTDMRRSFSDEVQGLPENAISRLADIGITTGDWREGGKLHVDEGQLRQAIAEEPNEVMELFTAQPDGDGDGKASTGIAHRLEQDLDRAMGYLERQAGDPNGPELGQSNLGRELRRIDDRIFHFEDRMQQREDRYWSQFSAMERAMAEMNSQAMWMQQNMFGGM